MYVFSERHKVVNAIIPVADAFSANVTSDIVHLENYKKCTFLIVTGATSTDAGLVTVGAGATSTGAATAIPFKYRTQIAAAPPNAGSDVSSTLIDATSTGFAMTASKAGGLYIVEVDAAVVAAATAGYDHVALTVTEVGSTGVTACVLAILSEPRYPQDILVTAID